MSPMCTLPNDSVVLLAVLNPFARQNRYNRRLDRPLRMYLLHPHEVKCSRADLLLPWELRSVK
jgi:hypothetical protein